MYGKKKVGNGPRKPIGDLASRCSGSDNEGKFTHKVKDLWVAYGIPAAR